MKWEPRRAMNTRPMKSLEARISPLQQGECQLRKYLVGKMAEKKKYVLTFQNKLTPEEADLEKTRDTRLGKALREAEEVIRE